MNTALIRICNGCGVVTAIDMDNTPEHKKDMELHGHTIYEVSDAMTYWKTAGKCKCGEKSEPSPSIARDTTNDENNIKIAKFCGYEETIFSNWPTQLLNTKTGLVETIPNYCEDLKAMHSAECVLLQYCCMWDDYCDLLMKNLVENQGYQAAELLIHSSAKQRAIAFLEIIEGAGDGNSH